MDTPLEPIPLSPGKQTKAKEEAYLFKSDCRITYRDTGDAIKARFPLGDDFYPRVHAALSRNILQDEALVAQPDGIYCYVVFEREGAPHIAFARTRSAWEFGTKHSAIVYTLGLTELFFAGEFEKTGTNLRYNYLSGTYLEDYNSGISHGSSTAYAQLKAKRAATMESLLTPLGVTATYFEFPDDPYRSFIRTADMPVGRDEIDDLTRLGAVVTLYDTEALCKSEDTLTRQVAKLRSDIARIQGELATAEARLAAVVPGRPPPAPAGGRRRSRGRRRNHRKHRTRRNGRH